jgi:DNA-binding LacI/PurR family transcriptional regulator
MERTKLDRVYRHLHGEIVRGRFQSGERLPTEEELAERFGYSRTTVAKAIRMLARQGLVERRRRAGSFVRAGTVVRSQLLGALICGAAEPDPSANIFVPISREIAREAELAGYGVVVRDPLVRATDLAAIAAHIERMARELIERQVAGVLMVPYEIVEGQEESVSARGAELLADAGIPVVLVDRDICRYPQRSRFDLVGIDNRRAGCMATEHLLKAGGGDGAGRVDFAGSDLYGWAQEARIAGYLDALRNAGIDADPRWVHHGLPSDRKYIEGIVRDGKVRAVLATNDYTASQLMRAALEAGRRVPDDLRIIGVDDLPYGPGLPVPLTTVAQPVADLGAVAVRTLFDRMRHPGRRTTDVTVSFQLVVRKSCGARA